MDRATRLTSQFLALLLITLASSLALADDGMPAGSLQGGGHRFPLRKAEVRARILGPVAWVTVRQLYENPLTVAASVAYTYPLPDRAAIDDFRLVVGTRVIHSEILGADEARRLYKDRAQAGKVASLIEQIRPNLFSQEVSNISPGEQIIVEITYVEDLRYDRGGYDFHFPMVVGPRYKSAEGDDSTRLGGNQAVEHYLDLSVEIDAGLPIWAIESKSHDVDIVQTEESRAHVTLTPYDTYPNKEFLLSFKVATETAEPAVFTHRTGSDGYFSILIQPPEQPSIAEVWAREMVFVIDCSGSMGGMPNETAKKVVLRTLETLRPCDTFQILRFSDEATKFARSPLPATYDNVQRGVSFVTGLHGNGGTEMLSGIRLALKGQDDPSRMRIVHFLTDGLIGNEPEILSEVKRSLGTARIFPLGVGANVNRFLLERMAQLGRGTVAYIRHDASSVWIDAEVDKFVGRVRTPVLTDIEIDWGGLPVKDISPDRVPDGFSGRPLFFHGRYTGPARGTVILRGRQGGTVWRRDYALDLPRTDRRNPALGKLWARARISDLMLDEYAGGLSFIKEEIARLAIDHHLLSAYTSFVAVDESHTGIEGKAEVFRQPAPWPEGVGGGEFYGVLLGRIPHGSYLPPAPDIETVVSKSVRPGGPSRAPFRRDESQAELHLGLLMAEQKRDGAWEGGDGLLTDVGATSLSLLAFRASGKKARKGYYGKCISKGLTALKKMRDKDGCYGDRDRGAWLLEHALATLARLEYYKASGSKSTWQRPAKAVQFLISQQSLGLGWSRDGKRAGGDSLTTLFALCALKSAEEVGIKVDPSVIEGARKWFFWVADVQTGAVRMNLHVDPTELDCAAVAAGAVAVRMLGAGPKEGMFLTRAARLLLKQPPPVDDRADPIYLFLATAAMKMHGGVAWGEWNPPLNEAVRGSVVPGSARDEAGNPILVGPSTRRLGRIASLALFGMARVLYDKTARPFVIR